MNYKTLSSEEAKNELTEDNDIILLDVRTKEEYDVKHIPNCILMPLDELNEDNSDKIESTIKNKKSKIFIYCKSGRRSKLAAEKLTKLGYENVYTLEGGINSWKYETK